MRQNRLQQEKDACQSETDCGAGNRDPELSRGAGWFGPDLGDTAEYKERDASHPDFV